MSTAAPALDSAAPSALSPTDVTRIWVKHLVSLYIPMNTLLFLWTGPHAWYVAPLFIGPMVLAHQIDCAMRYEHRQPDKSLPAWPFDVLVYLLVALQLLIVYETVQLFTVQGIFSLDMVMVFVIVGGSSGFSIITAHELIHRRGRVDQALGRLLLCAVLYEHFYTEHLRGHHVRVGTPEDPATARFGESYDGFFRRTVPAQFRSAWRLEKHRLGDADMSLFDGRMLKNRIVHGLLLQWGVAFAILAGFGLPSFFAFVLQAYVAISLLEAVNYFEHWGLKRTGRRVRPVDSWDTHSWFTFYGLIGLSRHADHHAYPARAYQQLRVWEAAPILPYGYVGMVDQVMGKNEEFQLAASEELGRRRLGPFKPVAVEGEPVQGSEAAEPGESGDSEPLSQEVVHERLAEAQAEEQAERMARTGWLGRTWQSQPLWLRRVLFFGGLVVVGSTIGVQWETGGAEMGFAGRLFLHAWILAAFTGAILVWRRLQEQIPYEIVGWVVGFGALALVGLITNAIV